jgi:hypothetical protein
MMSEDQIKRANEMLTHRAELQGMLKHVKYRSGLASTVTVRNRESDERSIEIPADDMIVFLENRLHTFNEALTVLGVELKKDQR